MKEKVTVSWSGGKDCTLALYEIIHSQQFTLHSLHTTFNIEAGRVGLHGVKQELIDAQAQSIGITLDKIFIPSAENHAAYEAAINKYYRGLSAQGIKKVVFGDIFLEDLKTYREKMLAAHKLQGIFPLWKKDSRRVAEKFTQSGFKAVICSANSKYFNEKDLERDYDLSFINSLPDEVDPCGENGEFHTFVYNGPIFKTRIPFQRKQVEAREYNYKVTLPDGQSENRTSKFWFQELE